MHRISNVVFVFSLLFSLSSLAGSDCNPLRMDKGEGLLTGIPAINQGNLKYCSNVSASLMITAYIRQTQPDLKKVVVSPEKMWTQVLSRPDEERKNLLSANGGRICNSIELAKSRGVCDRNEVLKIILAFSESALKRKAHGEVLDLTLEELTKRFKEIALKKASVSIEEITKLRLKIEALGIPPEYLPTAEEIAERNAATDGHRLLNLVFRKACDVGKGLITPFADGSKAPKCKKVDFVRQTGEDHQMLRTPENFKKVLHTLLDKPLNEALPIGISYCSGVLTDPSASYISSREFSLNVEHLNTSDYRRNLSPYCSFHASVVIGRERRSDGKCYFLVLNSWGPSCTQYSSRKDCERGKVWVEENALTKNIVQVSYLE